MLHLRKIGPTRSESKLVDQAIKHFQYAQEQGHPEEKRPSRIITISRQLGSGGRRIAEIISRQLGWPIYDKEILELLARSSGVHYREQMFAALDERVQSEMEGFFASLMGQMDQHTYFYLLPRVILTLAQTDCIILGRGAHLLLPDSIKTRIEASPDIRIKNLIGFEGYSDAEARQRIKRSDKAREGFLHELAVSLPEKYQWYKKRLMYDLTINTDHLSTADTAAIIITAAEQKFGFSAGEELHLHRKAGSAA